MRLIDADALIERLDNAIQDAKHNGEIYEYWEDDRANVLYYLDTAPTIDAVEVVRCKDCKHSDVYISDSMGGISNRWCTKFMLIRIVNNDEYCSCGERREQCTSRR